MLLKKMLTIFTLFFFHVYTFSQEVDSTESEESGREMYTSVDVSFSKDEGNTNYLSRYYGFDFTLLGNAGPLTDTEFLISYYRTDDVLDEEPFSDDASLTLKFDIWANQRISPFLFAQQTFDKTVGLNSRLNYGLGAKFGIFKWFSISYAFLAESEEFQYSSWFEYTDSTGIDYFRYTDSIGIDYWDYSDSSFIGLYDYDSIVINEDDYYYYDTFYDTWDAAYFTGDFDANGDSVFTFYNYDSTLIDGYWAYYGDSTKIGTYYVRTDSIEDGTYYEITDSSQVTVGGKVDKFYRHSIRPKIKLKFFDENLVFDYRFYYKPRVDDFKDYILEHELSISLATFYDLLSIDLNYTNKYNTRFDINNGGRNIINPLTGVPYKERDESIILGLSFSF